MANEWFYAKDGQKFGPVSGKRLKELATIGVLRRNDLIWSPGYSVWRPAKKFRGLLPKMDATSLTPAMSLFWRPVDIDTNDGGDDKLRGMFLEPDSPATAITPPLPGAAAKKAVATSAPAGKATAAPVTVRPTAKRPAAPSQTTARTSSAPARAVRQAEPVVTTASKPKWRGMSSKEKLAIAGGLVAIVVIYGVLMYRALL
jgi:hypothetical protein